MILLTSIFLLFSMQTAKFKLVFFVYFVSTDKKTQEDIQVPHFRPEALDTIRMEDLIKEHLTSKENVSVYSQFLFLCLSVKSEIYVMDTEYVNIT